MAPQSSCRERVEGMSEKPLGRAASPRPPGPGSSRRDGREEGRDGTPSRPSGGALGESALPARMRLPHDIPAWVEAGAVFFITVCSEPRGQDNLCRGDMPTRLRESILHRTKMGQWWPHLVLVMQDHLHALTSFASLPGMRKAMGDWKRFTARTIGIQWQRDFFDHRLRHDESFVEKAHYIRMNPVRAGLVTGLSDWPHVWTMNGALGESALPDW